MEIKDIVAKNLTNLRIKNKLTQGEVASMVNYTDKSVSKWEHGEAMPPIDILKKLADIYKVSLDYLVTDSPDFHIKELFALKEKNTNKIVITLLSVSFVWIIATLLFVYGLTLAGKSFWILFIFAIPMSIVVLIIFNAIWGKRFFTFILISIGIWSVLLSAYLMFLPYNLWALFILGIPLQISTILWSQLVSNKKKKLKSPTK